MSLMPFDDLTLEKRSPFEDDVFDPIRTMTNIQNQLGFGRFRLTKGFNNVNPQTKACPKSEPLKPQNLCLGSIHKPILIRALIKNFTRVHHTIGIINPLDVAHHGAL